MADKLQIFADAVQQSLDQIKLEHPLQYQDIDNEFGAGEIGVAVNNALQQDAAYLKLVAETNAETNVPAIIGQVLPLVISVIGKLTGITVGL